METKKYEAAEKKCSGKYNCAQAVICTYCDRAGLDEVTGLNIGNGFAVGMGNKEGTCGALIGAGVILGLIQKDRIRTMQGMRQIMERFQERNGATQCRLLKGIDTKKVLRECHDCVADAAEFLEDVLDNKA